MKKSKPSKRGWTKKLGKGSFLYGFLRAFSGLREQSTEDLLDLWIARKRAWTLLK
jgi:hypothetical protein